MHNPFRHLFAKGPDLAQPLAFQRWAERNGHDFRRARGASGCVVEGSQGPHGWRIEWGASHRSYVPGNEIRLMADLGLSHAVMAMVLNRVLLASMETEVYDQFINDVQTRIDTDTPPEMRWLVMYAKLEAPDLGPLKDRFGAVASVTPWLRQWLTVALRASLMETIEQVRSDQPFSLVVARGRLTLRTAMPEPDADKLALWFSVFEQALAAACLVGDEWQHTTGAGVLSTQTGAWAHTLTPRETELGHTR